MIRLLFGPGFATTSFSVAPGTLDWRVDERDVIEQLGKPTEIVGREARMRARIWKCSSCGAVTHSERPVHIPAPCVRCAGIAFRAIGNGRVLPEV